VAGAPGRDDWQRQSGASLAARLRRWSVKQVRTHFERLHQLGVIAAERPQGNGAWFYALPEEFTAASNRYRQLPTAEELPNHIGNTG